ncbi:TetR/AcrR family transcriptional regulator [Jatrophihabitans fulvus]
MGASANPLFDTLFRPTTDDAPAQAEHRAPAVPAVPPARPAPVARPAAAPVPAVAAPVPAVASAAPVRVTGTRTRAGNAMSRTRAALLSGAARAVATSGTRIAMAQVATAAGVAKATLYNHFRTRDAVLAALVLDQVQHLVDAHADEPLDTALAATALAISRNETLRGLAAVEPAALAALARIDEDAPAWQLARTGVAQVLAGSGRTGTDTVLRWLASFLLSPAAPATIADDVAVLVAGLPVSTVAVDAATESAAASAAQPLAASGAPGAPTASVDGARTA